MESTRRDFIQAGVALASAAGLTTTETVANGAEAMQAALKEAGAESEIVGPHLGTISGKNGANVEAVKTFANSSPATYDAVYAPGGASAATLKQKGDAHVFVAQAYKHGKAIAATGEGVDLLTASLPEGASLNQMGVVSERDGGQRGAAIQKFLAAVGSRHWGRPALERVSA